MDTPPADTWLRAPSRRRGREFERDLLEAHSIGSTLIIDAPWLLPTQNVGGSVELSTSTRRMLVGCGNRYSIVSPVLLLTRTTRSVDMPPVQISPFLSMTA